jgi:hypothetical protein
MVNTTYCHKLVDNYNIIIFNKDNQYIFINVFDINTIKEYEVILSKQNVSGLPFDTFMIHAQTCLNYQENHKFTINLQDNVITVTFKSILADYMTTVNKFELNEKLTIDINTNIVNLIKNNILNFPPICNKDLNEIKPKKKRFCFF